MSTLIAHIYNEEFLLPFWLKHHLPDFDNGIIIDFYSTDSSLDIVRNLAPHWKIIRSTLPYFEAEKLDRLVESIEASISGPRLCLNVTEFLIGDPRKVKGQLIIPQVSLINLESDEPFNNNLPFHQQRKAGLIADSKLSIQDSRFPIFSGPSGRSLHDFQIRYPLGRHFLIQAPTEMLIYRVSDCFVAEEMYKRRLQIQEKIPTKENSLGRGRHHTNHGRGLNLADLKNLEKTAREYAVNLEPLIEQAMFMREISISVRHGETVSHAQLKRAWTYSSSNFAVEGVPNFQILSDFALHEIARIQNAFEKSWSWKITSPLRWFKDFLRSAKEYVTSAVK